MPRTKLSSYHHDWISDVILLLLLDKVVQIQTCKCLLAILWHRPSLYAQNVYYSFYRTHKGSGERTITVGLLRQVAHLPQQEAADRLNVGNTRFKTATRELGMQAWPYRKIKSIRNLLAVVKEDPDLFCVRTS